MKTIRLVLIGVGNLGRRFCALLLEKGDLLRARYALEFVLVGAADSRGAACDPRGLDLTEIVRVKAAGGSVAECAGGRPDWDGLALLDAVPADVLLEASPVNLAQGAEPGLACLHAALRRGMHVVTPNKGPLVLAYRELHALARDHGALLRFDGAVAGGLPAVNLGARDLRGAVVEQLDAVPNLVTGYVMDMLADGVPWDDALARAYAEGVLEGDGAWDLEGWDAAAKLVILANAVLDYPATLDMVARAGIVGLDATDLAAARTRGERYRLVASAIRQPDGTYTLSVAPQPLPPAHPFGRLGRKEMAVRYTTDIYGTITAIIEEPDPVPSAATMLRDLLDIYVQGVRS